MSASRRLLRGVADMAILLAGGSGAWAQGVLIPPGAPAPTMRTLTQVEPRTPISNANFTISSSGSYYLTTNLVCAESGIIIAASYVTLDLNGFSIIGRDTNSEWGIHTSGGYKTNVVVRNGTVQGFGQLGMDVSMCRGSLFENLALLDNFASGMSIGINSQAINCRAANNNAFGLRLNNRSSAIGCSAWGNRMSGIDGDHEVIILNCIAYSNLHHGINVDNHCQVKNCVSTCNSSNGITTMTGSVIEGNNSSSNGIHGISVQTRCLVKNNNCIYNGRIDANGAGIHALNLNNRIEENHVASNDTGIWCPGVTNWIAKNTAVGNTTEYNVAPGNRIAPIDTTGAFTNPWANFDF